VLCLQDAPNLDVNGQAVTGMGPLNTRREPSMIMHSTYAVTLSREPLGLLDAWM
jgi:hypothetical protein